MFERDIYTIHSTYREDMHIKGFQFGKGEKSACIVGAARGNEIQQMYICSQLVKTLRELENNGCISAGKQILVIPTINAYSVNISRRFFGVKEADINRSFPGNDYGEPADRPIFIILCIQTFTVCTMVPLHIPSPVRFHQPRK